MTINIEKSVSFTGHRTSKMGLGADIKEGVAAIFDRTYEVVIQLYRSGYDTFLSGMAEGFDILAAEAVLMAQKTYPDIKLIAVIPYNGQSKILSPHDNERYQNLLYFAHDKIVLSEHYYKGVFLHRNDYLLRNTSKIVCYYNGDTGGTMYTINRAKKAGHSIINMCMDYDIK